MIKAMRVGNTIVCTIGSKMYQKVCNSNEEILSLYEKALNINELEYDEVASLIACFEVSKTKDEERLEEQEKDALNQKNLIDWLDSIRNLGDEHFEVIGIKLYMKGINITVPEFLALEFAKRRDNQEDLSAMMNFWRLCALNPDPRCREDLYKFLINNDLTLTPSGYFVAYRNVNVKNEGLRERNEFVAEQWLKIKTQKRGPKNFVVVWNNEDKEFELMHEDKWEVLKDKTYEIDNGYEDEDGEWIEEWEEENLYEYQGNLQELYVEFVNLEASEQTVYTDGYTGRMEIILGQPVKIDRKQCDANPDRTCSRGLHAANSSWLTSGYFGSVGLAVLINPMHVIAVPYTDGGKLRCCEYLPIATIEYNDEGKVIPIDTNTFELEYAEYTQEELEDLIENTPLESLKEHEIIPKEISLYAFRKTIQDLRNTLCQLTEVVSNRVKNV
jgi:hypothetical protein